MSARAAKMPRPEAPPPRRRWRVVVNEGSKAPPFTPADRLEQAAKGAPRSLPHRAALEAAFDMRLGDVQVVETPDAAAALDAEEAEAALVGKCILLRPEAPLGVVAHELAHLMQRRGLRPVDPDAAEREASQVAAEVAAGKPVGAVNEALPAGTVAFLRDTEAETELAVRDDDEARREFQVATGETRPEAAAPQEATEAPQPETQGASPELDLGGDVRDAPVPTFEPAPMPEIEADEATAERTAEAKQAIAGAEDADALVAAFQTAPPSIKAARHDTLDADANRLSAEDQAAFDADLPEFEAQMTGDAALPAPAPVAPPGTVPPTLEDGAPGPAPEPQVEPTPDPGSADLNARARDIVARLFTPGDASGLGRAFDGVSTNDTDVDTSAGARPDVPLEGESDPERVTARDTTARADAVARRDEAARAVVEGPGPETVQLHAIRETYTLEPREMPATELAEGGVEGACAFRDKGFDPEVTALFDAYHQDAMAAGLEGARAETENAVQTRDTDRDTAVAEAERERDELNAQADRDQQAEVTARRQDVQNARQKAVDDQAGHVGDLEALADHERRIAEGEVESQVTTTETEVAARFDQAETDAQTEVSAGEIKAEAERKKREREAENQSWWDRATDWVAEQFDKLTAFINEVFDAVRAAVKDIIDKAKAAAVALIDTAVKAIAEAIEAFGEALKGAVNALLQEHFPEVARVLNEAIDGAVEIATEAVEAVGEALKVAVSALLDALAAGLDAILAAYQAALNAALALARAVLTGDWAELARLVLEPILLALGIQPAAFYDLLGRAQKALGIIIDDPVGFLQNLVDAVTGGIRQFADNLFTHLQAGIIGWLTGALGGIQIPERWDIRGVLDLARQILGLTVDMIRRVAVRVLGEAAVERIEFFMGYAAELISSGWQALWDKITADLGNLKDAVLEQIKSFLFERVVMASITWLASLFSPVGALVKLVTTIWNFLMFLKDQLARIIAVVQKVVQSMYEIATGVLAPAMQGIEDVLARLLPVAIDLLARLLGLGNVAGRVQRIIAGIQQKIEDAIAGLIERVLARFRGGGRGDDAEDAAEGDARIMAPLTVQGGDETHTLSIADQGATVVPMIRSTPMTLSQWLDGRMGRPFTERAEDQGWRGDERADKRRELQGLVDRAKQEEGLLDRVAEEAEDAANDEAEGRGSAANEKAEVGDQAQDTKRAIEAILEFLGLTASVDLAERFKNDLAAMHGEAAAQLTSRVFPRLESGVYATLTWAQAKDMIASEAVLPSAWKRPAASDGILRRTFGEADFRAAVKAVVRTALPESPIVTDESGDELTVFLDRKLTAELNQPARVALLLDALLSGARTATASLQPVAQVIKNAAAPDGEALEYDYAFKRVTGTFYKNTLPDEVDNYIHGAIFGDYFEKDDENTAGSGEGVPMRMVDFIKNSTSPPISKRASKNRQRMADAVRGADPGQHEWIASRLAAAVVTKAADEVARGNMGPLEGAGKVLKFQHEVRTPTEKLIFKPSTAQVEITYKAYPHRQSAEHAATHMDDLPDDLRAAWYPPGGLQQDDRVGVLQGHPGAVYARVQGGAQVEAIKPQSSGHHAWDQALEGIVTRELADGTVLLREAENMGEGIVSHFRNTIWAGSETPKSAAGRVFQVYFDSGRSAKSYADLRAIATDTGDAISDLETAIERVFQ